MGDAVRRPVCSNQRNYPMNRAELEDVRDLVTICSEQLSMLDHLAKFTVNGTPIPQLDSRFFRWVATVRDENSEVIRQAKQSLAM